MERPAREAERITRDDNNAKNTMLHWKVDVAMVEAQVLENAEAMHAVVANGKYESEKVKIECVSEYVCSRIDLQNCSASPLLSVLSMLPHSDTELHDSFITWLPPVKDISQPINNNQG